MAKNALQKIEDHEKLCRIMQKQTHDKIHKLERQINRFVQSLINPLLLPLVTDRKHFAKLSARKKRANMLRAKRSTSK
jgi:hypothetical protein